VWNADHARAASPKKASPPEVRDDAHVTLLTVISSFGDSTHPLFISKLKTFETMLLTAQNLYQGHGYTIRSASRMFLIDVFFVDWLETIFFPSIAELRQKFPYDSARILIIDG
jgi:hypothetical protein